MTKCDYCHVTIQDSDNPTYKHGKIYHASCFMSRIHDILTKVETNAEAIVAYTQDNNSGAYTRAKRILEILNDF